MKSSNSVPRALKDWKDHLSPFRYLTGFRINLNTVIGGWLNIMSFFYDVIIKLHSTFRSRLNIQSKYFY